MRTTSNGHRPKLGGMATSRSGAYNTGISELDVEKRATEDGKSGILDPAIVGVNSHLHSVDGLVDAHASACGVIAHDTRGDIQTIDEDLEAQTLVFASDEAAAREANSKYEAAERQRIVQRAFMKKLNLPVPSKKAFLLLAVALIGLFVGDWGLITLGYQVLGLSDDPWIPGVAFTDDLHLAAFSSVFALVILGHGVGDRLRRIEHALNIRSQADEPERDRLPMPAPFDFVWLTICLLGALAGLTALSHIRSEYLKALGSSTGGLAFFAIQFVILLAAIALGLHHANPEARHWATVEKEATAAAADLLAAVETVNATGSRLNAGIDRREAILALAGHHINTDAANVGVQASAYKRRYLLSQLEPAQEKLFGEHKATREFSDAQLLDWITGITPLPTFKKVTTANVMADLEKTRFRLDALRAHVDQIDIRKLNLTALADEAAVSISPERDSESEYEQNASEAPLHPVQETASVSDRSEDDATEEAA